MRRAIQRFEVIAELGAGGMGTVYRARDPHLEREVAIKVLSSSEEARSELSTMLTIDMRDPENPAEALLREARMMARLSHPNVIPVYEVGLDGTSVFVVMEHVAGADLRAWLASEARPTAAILGVFAQAAAGLAAAHERGIVHRDFKPDNVLIGADGRARVADFGLSRLVAGQAAPLVRVAGAAGTPRYMAPELWTGHPATAACDVFAFCTALVEALGAEPTAEARELERRLRERGVPARLRAAALAGLSVRPADRPEIGQLVAALNTRTRRRWVLAGATALAAAAVAVIAAAGSSGSAPACDDDPRLFAGRWDLPVKALLATQFAPDRAPRLAAMLTAVDARAAELASAHRGACEAAETGAITAAQRAQRQSCLERRAIELGARARVLAKPTATARLTETEEVLLSVGAYDCDRIVAPPLPVERAALAEVAALHARHWEVQYEQPYAASPDALGALQRTAVERGELELAIAVGVTRGERLVNLDRFDEAAEVLVRAHNDASAIRSEHLEVTALLSRAYLAATRGDHAAGRQLVELALEKVRAPAFSRRLRVAAHARLANVQLALGEWAAAIATSRAGLDEIAKTGEPMGDAELSLRIVILNALGFLERSDELLAYATESAARAEELIGKRTFNYAVVLEHLGRGYSHTGDHARALEVRMAAHQIKEAEYGAEHSSVVMGAANVANDLTNLNRLADAHAMVSRAVRVAERKPELANDYPHLLSRLGETTFELGRHDEGVRMLARGVERLISVQGADHPQTLDMREVLADLRIELRALDEAERDLEAIADGYRRKPEPRDRRPATLRGTLAAKLARARGAPHHAEQLARAAIAELTELAASAGDLRAIQHELGRALIAQQRFAEARPLIEQALATAAATHEREDSAALSELALAEIELGLGQRAAGVARAQRAAEMLARWPGQPLARAAAAKLFAQSPGRGRKP